MINRQAMRGAGTKTTTKAPARTKLTKGAGARATVKAKGKAKDAAAVPGRATGAKARTKTTSAAPASRAGRRNGDSQGRGSPRAAVWRGEEVSSPSPLVASSAEEAALRAEGNAPVPAEVVARDPDHGTFVEKGPARRPRADDPDVAENAEEKRQSAAEEHASQPSRHFPFGRL